MAAKETSGGATESVIILLGQGFYRMFNYAFIPVVCLNKSSHVLHGMFSHDITAAILVSQNNETAAMLVSQTNPVGVELFSYVISFFCCN